MPLDALYQADTDLALKDLVQRPPAAPQPTANFSLWRAIGGAVRGAAAGAAVEPLAFGTEVAGALGDATWAYGVPGNPLMLEGVSGADLNPAQQRESQRRIETGETFSNPTADAVRQFERDHMMPDPQTSHFAERLTFGFARLGAKAAVYSAVPYAGPALLATDEGFAASDELRQQGVDFGTRAEVGAVQGVSAALGMRLPLAGKTIASTAALWAAGGPGSYIASQAASRAILQHGNYSDLASQYDPFEPVGLAVSALVPGAFAIHGMRAQQRAARAKEVGETPPAGDTAAPAAQETPEAAAARLGAADPEMVDAARVQQVRELVDSWNLGDPKDVDTANQAMMAAMRAADQLASGDRVSVTDLVPVQQSAAARAIDDMIGRLETARTDLVAQVNEGAEPGAVRAMRDELAELQAAAPDASDAGIRALAKDIQAQNAVSYKAALSTARRQMADLTADHEARIARVEGALERNAEANRAQQALGGLDAQLEQARAARAQIDAPATSLRPVAEAVRSALGPDTGRSAPRAEVPREQVAARAEGQQTEGAAAVERPPTDLSGTPEQMTDAHLDERLRDLVTARPDLPVSLEEGGEHVRLADAIEAIEREAQQDAADAPLIQVAAKCFLSL